MALVPEWGIELGRYFKAVLVWWVKTVGGSIVAFFQIFYALNYKQAPPVISWCLLGVCFTVAGFLAWRDEYKRAERLQSRMKSRIRVSCGKSVNQSVVSADGEMWYRARLDLEGYTPIPDIEATVTELWEDGKRVLLQECLTLTMYPGILKQEADFRTLNEGKPEFVDVIRVADGMAIFPLKFYPRAVAHGTLLTPKHTYRIIVAIYSHANRTDICTFEFEWTGDPDTSDIRLMSVTPPSDAEAQDEL
ncbi:MAG: hypothetical protein DMF12_00080 [Verrucomicrobia bacterium]|nr:MAG: hypothetical protein AUH19_04240 [Verrucomicrobia bacterium 13_2_20CM_55_10]PYI44362.1 MAG: hypothetical protein DMF12_00080 [Verrucomicrobiota bacterium]